MLVSTNDVRATALTVPIIAIIITIIRLVERIRTRKFGLDDGFATSSAILLSAYVVSMTLHLSNSAAQPQAMKVALYYILSQLFSAVVWCTRLSILFSIVRLATGHTMRRLLYCLAAIFFFFWGLLFAQTFWVCENDPNWKDAALPQCNLGIQVGILQLIADVFANTVIVLIPAKMLLNPKVSEGHHVRVLLILASGMTTTVVSIVHAFLTLKTSSLEGTISAIIEASTSLIACNLLVVFTTVMRVTGLGGEDDSPELKENYISIGEYRVTSTFRSMTLPSSSGTQVEYGDTFKFSTIGRKSPSLLGGPDASAGIYIKKEQVYAVSFSSVKGV